jgi:adenosine deaminase
MEDPELVARLRAEQIPLTVCPLSNDDARLAALARNSFDACFAAEADKRRWKAEVDSWLVRTPA